MEQEELKKRREQELKEQKLKAEEEERENLTAVRRSVMNAEAAIISVAIIR